MDIVEVMVGQGKGRLVDLSVGGLCLDIDRPLRPRSVLTIVLPGLASGLSLKAGVIRCRVRGIAGAAGVVYRTGMQFAGVDGVTRERLERAIEGMNLGSGSQQTGRRRPLTAGEDTVGRP